MPNIFYSGSDFNVYESHGQAADAALVSTTFSTGGFIQLNGLMYFLSGAELWQTDGTNAGTTLVKHIGGGSGNGRLIALNGELYFSANDSVHGTELWKSDGTDAGTVMVKDINVANTATFGTGSNATNLTFFNNKIYFSATDGTAVGGHGQELYVYDPVADTTTLKEINPGTASSSPGAFTEIGNFLVFSATDATHGTELWAIDKTNGAGTPTLVKDIEPGSGSPFLGSLVHHDNLLFFAAEGTFWKTDGTTGGTVDAGITAPANTVFSSINNVTDVDGTLFFSALTTVSSVNEGFELWKLGAGATVATLVDDINPGSGNGLGSTSFIAVGDKLFFTASDGTHGVELWVSDGTLQNTFMVKDINATALNNGDARIFTGGWQVVDGVLYFLAQDFASGGDTTSATQLWRSDGTAAGTFQLATGVSGNSQIGILDDTVFVNIQDAAAIVGSECNATDYFVNGAKNAIDAAHTATQFTLHDTTTTDNSFGSKIDLIVHGTGFVYSGGAVTAGTITGFDIKSVAASAVMSIVSNTVIDAASFYTAAKAGELGYRRCSAF